MFCTNCGANLPEGTMFCTNCGSAMENNSYVDPSIQANAPTKETKQASKIDVNAVKDTLTQTLKPVKKIFGTKKSRIGLIAGVVAVLAICIVCAILFSGNGYTTVKQSVNFKTDDGTLYISVNGKLLDDTLDLNVKKGSDGDPILSGGDKQYLSYSTRESMDGKITAIMLEEIIYVRKDGKVVDSYEGGDLYVLNGKKLQHIADDVYSFNISVDGKGITYTTKNNNDEGNYTLNLYKVGKKKSFTVSEEATASCMLSPNGKSVVYQVAEWDKEKNKTEYSIMYYYDEESTEIISYDSTEKKYYSVIGLSNKGKYIYVMETDYSSESTEYTMYSYNKKGESSKLGECNGYGGYMNEDHTQIMFCNDGETFIAKKDKAAEKVSKKELRMLAPDTAGYSSSTYPVSDLFGQVYYCQADTGYDVYLIKSADKSNKLIDGGYNISMDDSGEYLYYTTKKDDLKCVEISMSKNAKNKAVKIADDVQEYEVTSDRKYVYFLNEDNELMCVNGKKGGDVDEICSDNVYDFALTKKDVVFYLVKDIGDDDGELFVTKKGKPGKTAEDDIEYIYATQTGEVFAIAGDDVYVSTGSKKLEQLEIG